MGLLVQDVKADSGELDAADSAGLGAEGAEGFDRLYRMYGTAIFRYLLRFTRGDRREAEDLLQETMLRAWRHIEDDVFTMGRVRPWLYTVARRIAVDKVRAQQIRPVEADGADLAFLASQEDTIDRALIAQAVRQGLMALSEEHRNVLVEVFYNDRSPRDAAEVLGIPEGTVKSRTHYALRALAATTAVVDIGR